MAPAAAHGNPWLEQRVLNMAHQGGEAEAPSGTMYALKRAMKLGADMLEVDVHTTADGRLVVLHDSRVDRTTNGSGVIYGMNLKEVQRLDAAYDFVPGEGPRTGRPERDYPFRGVRTGERKPPPGYRARDFRIPTLDEVLRTFPRVPINIEIKGLADSDNASFFRNADALAALLNGIGRSEGVIVASFNQMALERFHAQAPEVALAPALPGIALFKFANLPLAEGMAALQVPITFQGIQVTDADFVKRAHAQGYAVHVWLSNDPENEEIYDRLLSWDVDAVMPAEPGRFEDSLCEHKAPRPPRPKDWPGGKRCSKRYSIACKVEVIGYGRSGRKLRLILLRYDDFAGRCAGRVRVRARGLGTVARGRFDFGKLPPSQGGPEERSITMRSKRAGVGATPTLRTIARPYDAFPTVTTFHRLPGRRAQ